MSRLSRKNVSQSFASAALDSESTKKDRNITMTTSTSYGINSKDLLASRVALLTASTSGIGAESARQLAQAGASAVIINGRNEAKGQALAAELGRTSPATKFVFIKADVVSPGAADMLFKRVADGFGRLDIFVHCGGAQIKPDLFINSDPATYQPQIDGHFTCMLHCCHYAVALMRQTGGGAIVTVASDAGKLATPGETIIGAAKAAAIMFTRTLAIEVSRFAIRANCITPSIVRDTISHERAMSGELSRKVFEKAEARARLGVPTPADIAPLVVFLASPLASKITGQAISVNGGISAA